MDTQLKAHVDSVSVLAQAICSAFDQQLEAMGFEHGKVEIAAPHEAVYRREADPSTGENGLIGVWRNAEGHKCGELIFHADGTFFAEYDVIRVHPKKPRWFVEAVTAWGKGSRIKSEPRLLPMVS